jgi:hypothetical protein
VYDRHCSHGTVACSPHARAIGTRAQDIGFLRRPQSVLSMVGCDVQQAGLVKATPVAAEVSQVGTEQSVGAGVGAPYNMFTEVRTDKPPMSPISPGQSEP